MSLLLAYCKNEFELNERQDDKQTLRYHLEQVYRMTGEMPDRLKPVDCPDWLIYIWHDFLELNQSRGSNGFVANPISYQEIDCWNRLTGKAVTQFEVDTIKMIDSIYLDYQSKRMADK